VCKWHRSAPVEYFCNYNNEFYCKLCIPERHYEHDDLPLHDIQAELQEAMTKLKLKYITKRTHILDRVVAHRNKLEKYMKIYYDTLDDLRSKILREEYKIDEQLEEYEHRMKKTLDLVQNYSVIEFYYEKAALK
jgi:hypothetical protein